MQDINFVRLIIAGFLAGVLIWVTEAISGTFYSHRMKEALESHNLSLEMTTQALMLSILASMLAGFFVVFIYVLARTRFGSGPVTAVLAGVAVWSGSNVPSLLGYFMLGLFPDGLIMHWAVVGLIQLILAGLLGAVIYSEKK